MDEEEYAIYLLLKGNCGRWCEYSPAFRTSHSLSDIQKIDCTLVGE
jgi:hypothetical protein